MPRRLLLIGCEAADWPTLHTLTDAGTLPTLHRLIEGGASGPLAGSPPLQRDMLWTSLATGRRASTHGVTGAAETRPDGGGVQPTGRRSWRAAPFWEILDGAGIPCAVVNWPATRPGGDWRAAVVDDSFAQARGKDFDDWPLPPDCARQELRAMLRALRVHPADIVAAEIEAFVPELRSVDQATDPGLAQIAYMLSEAASVHAAATHLAAESSWDLLAVHYRLLDHAQRGFLRFKSGVGSDPAARLYGGVVDAAYRFQDMLIGRLLEICGADTDVLVLSPCGVGQSDGVLIACGPSFARDRIVHGATLFDIAPTVLALLGLEYSCEGRVLVESLAGPLPPLRPASRSETSPASEDPDFVPALDALGYRDTLTEAQQQAIRDTEFAALLNLAEAEMAFGAWREAVPLLRRALAVRPDHLPALRLLAHCLALLDEWEACVQPAEKLLALDPDSVWGNLLKGAIHALVGEAAVAEPYLAKARAHGQAMPPAQLLFGLLALRLRDPSAAEEHFRAALALRADFVEALHGLTVACREQGKLPAAEASLRQAIALRYHFARAHFLLGQVLAEQGRLPEAAHAMRAALQLDPAMSGAERALARIVQTQIAAGRDRT